MPITSGFHVREIEVRHAKIHRHGRRTAYRISMLHKQRSQGCHVVRSFMGIRVIAILTETYSFRTKRLVTFAITDTYSTPVVTLNGDQWSREHKPGGFGSTAQQSSRKLSHGPSSAITRVRVSGLVRQRSKRILAPSNALQ